MATSPTATATLPTATATAMATTRGRLRPATATATATGPPTATATATTKLFQPSIQSERTDQRERERGYDEPKVFEESLITRKLSRLSRELRIQAVVVKNTR